MRLRQLLPLLAVLMWAIPALAVPTPTAVPAICPGCDCTFSAVGPATHASTNGHPDVTLPINDPGTTPGDAVICAVAYDTFVHGMQPPDGTWSPLANLELNDGSGVTVFYQNYPGSSYQNPVIFANNSGLQAENISAACVPVPWRSGLDGAVQALAGRGVTASAIGSPVVITQTLDALINVVVSTNATVVSSPNYGSVAVQQNTFGPSVALVTTAGNPNVSPTAPNKVTLDSSQNSGVVSLALKCGPASTPTPTATATSTATATVTATGAATATPTATPTPGAFITNVVWFMGENQSFDTLFGTKAGVNGATTATLPNGGGTYSLTRCLNQRPSDLGHTYGNAITDIDGGLMDGWPNVAGCTNNECLCQYLQADAPNLWTLAAKFALGDNFFAPAKGPSLPNHMHMVAASSFLVNSNGVSIGTTNSWGADAPFAASDCTGSGTSSFGPWPGCTGAGTCLSCSASVSSSASRLGTTKHTLSFIETSLLDRFDAAGITWKYYGIPTQVSGHYWTIPNTFFRFGFGSTDWTNNVVSDLTFSTDAEANALPQVSLINTSSGCSMHAPAPLCTGENYLVWLLNEIAKGTQFPHMLFIWTPDEWGGTYDHQNPPTGASTLDWGIRVPIIVISPYSRDFTGYGVIHTQGNFDSVVLEIEEIFGLASLGNGDSTVGTDLSTYLDFTRTPINASVFNTTNLPQRTGSNPTCQTVPGICQ